jgi:transcriptional regulator of acetoin/glycerol metabolism
MRRRWRLTVIDGDDRGTTAELEETPALIGAAPAATLMITDDTVSRYHAEVDVFADGIRIRDLDSTNGTFLSGDDRVKEAFIENGATFRVGSTTLRAIAVDEPAASEIPTDPNMRFPGAMIEIGGAIAASPASLELIDGIRRVAASSSAVLFRGERGSGRATLAKVLHGVSARKHGPFVAVDAASLKREDYHRVLQSAHRGSLLIENVDGLNHDLQAALRHTTERGEVRLHGDEKSIRVDVRLLTSTSVELRRKWDFDPILIRRIAVVELWVPPLRERPEDAVAIANRHLGSIGLRAGNRFSACARLQPWPENVDQLIAALADPMRASPADGLSYALQGALLDDAVSALEGDVSLLARKLRESSRSLFGRLAQHDIDVDAP